MNPVRTMNAKMRLKLHKEINDPIDAKTPGEINPFDLTKDYATDTNIRTSSAFENKWIKEKNIAFIMR